MDKEYGKIGVDFFQPYSIEAQKKGWLNKPDSILRLLFKNMDGYYYLDTESIDLCPLEEGNDCRQAGSLAKVYCSLFLFFQLL